MEKELLHSLARGGTPCLDAEMNLGDMTPDKLWPATTVPCLHRRGPESTTARVGGRSLNDSCHYCHYTHRHTMQQWQCCSNRTEDVNPLWRRLQTLHVF